VSNANHSDTPIEIRPARIEDSKDIADLFNIAYNNSYPIAECTDVNKIEDIIRSKRDIWYVALHDSKVIAGTVGMPNKWNRTYETCRSVTHPDYRGGGIGKIIYKESLNTCYDQEDCDLTFGFPRTFNMYMLMHRNLDNPLLLVGYDGGMHIVEGRREAHLVGITKNPKKDIVRIIPENSDSLYNEFINSNILSKLSFVNQTDKYPEINIVGPHAGYYSKIKNVEIGYSYLPTSRSLQISHAESNRNNVVDALASIEKEIDVDAEYVFSFVLADKTDFIKDMIKNDFQITSYLPAWYYQDKKHYDCFMMVKKLYQENPMMYETQEIIKYFRQNFDEVTKKL